MVILLSPSHSDLVKISVRLPKQQVEFIDQLVATGLYVNRSDFIRDAIRDFMPKALKKLNELRGNAFEMIRKEYFMKTDE